MATIKTHKASRSTSRWSYEAYLSSSGGGTTRREFTDHLYNALQREGLRAFRDDDELRRGEDIMLALQKAIEGSRVSIIVLSQNYASSRWCLDDLVMILQRRSSGHLVLPVFYGVDPSEVRTQTGSLKAVFKMHERSIEREMGERKEYLKRKVQEWRMALKEVADLAGLELPKNILETDGRKIIHLVCVKVTEYVTTNNRAHPGRQDRRDSCASRLEDKRTRPGKRSKDEISSQFGNKREDAAKSLGISVSTLKRDCRHHGIPQWPNRRRNNVSGLPNPYGEKNPLPTFNTLSTNGQITMENDVGGQNLEPNECQPYYFEDPNFQNTRIAVYSENQAAGGSSEWVFQPEGQTTQSTAYPNSNALVFPQPHIASEEVLNDSFHAPGRPLTTILHTMPTNPLIVPHLIGGYSESTYPNLSGLVDPPHPQRASTQIPSENLMTLEDLSISPYMEEYGIGSINQTIPLCSNPTPSQQLMMPPLIASQDTSSVMVKATYGHDKIRFNLSFASGIIQLKKEVSKRLEIKPGSFNLECKDADGDFILIACDDDVRQYLQPVTLLGNQVIKLFVLDKVLNTTKFWDNCGCDYCTLLRWKIPRYV